MLILLLLLCKISGSDFTLIGFIFRVLKREKTWNELLVKGFFVELSYLELTVICYPFFTTVSAL